jgi:hypothetical protein
VKEKQAKARTGHTQNATPTTEPAPRCTTSHIRIPSPEDLAFTKFLSFFGREPSKTEKRLQDLKDFVDIANGEFNTKNFLNLLQSTEEKYKVDLVFEFLKNIVSIAEVNVLKPSWLFTHLILMYMTVKPQNTGIEYDYSERSARLSEPLEKFLTTTVDPDTMYARYRPRRVSAHLEVGIGKREIISSTGEDEFRYLTINYPEIDYAQEQRGDFSRQATIPRFFGFSQ